MASYPYMKTLLLVNLLIWHLAWPLPLASAATPGDPAAAAAPAEAAAPAALAPAAPAPRPAAEVSALDVRVSDLRDRPVTLRSFAGKVVVLVHEDKDANQQNRALKAALGKLLDAHRGRLLVVALADVSRYDYWPARGFVVKALNKLPHDQDSLVLADWKGALRQHLGLRRAESSVLVLERDGRTALLRRGDLPEPEAQAVLATIRGALGESASAAP